MGSGRGKSRRTRISLRRKPRPVPQGAVEALDSVRDFVGSRMPAWSEPAIVARATNMPLEQVEEVLDGLAQSGKMRKEYLATCRPCGAVLFRGPSRDYENKRCSCGLEYTAYGHGYEDKSILDSKMGTAHQTAIYIRNERWDEEVQERLSAAAVREAVNADRVTF